eukprot:scaffold70678_cov65-Phaeocystis_antarctica.AAC.1
MSLLRSGAAVSLLLYSLFLTFGRMVALAQLYGFSHIGGKELVIASPEPCKRARSHDRNQPNRAAPSRAGHQLTCRHAAHPPHARTHAPKSTATAALRRAAAHVSGQTSSGLSPHAPANAPGAAAVTCRPRGGSRSSAGRPSSSGHPILPTPCADAPRATPLTPSAPLLTSPAPPPSTPPPPPLLSSRT